MIRKRRLPYILGILLLLIAVLLFAKWTSGWTQRDLPDVGEQSRDERGITLIVYDRDGNKTEKLYEKQYEYLNDLLINENLAEGEDTVWGFLPKKILGIEINDGAVPKEYWAIIKNGEEVTADPWSTRVTLDDGDTIELMIKTK